MLPKVGSLLSRFFFVKVTNSSSAYRRKCWESSKANLMIAGGGFLSRPRRNIGDDLVRWFSRRQRERARVLSQQSNGERESHNGGDFVDRREKSAQGSRKTNATTTTREGRKRATRRAHAERAGPGTGSSHAWREWSCVHEWMNEWMIKWMNVRKLINFSVGHLNTLLRNFECHNRSAI